jgi:DNA-binding NarL/FixJ family response regulator
LLCHLLGGRQLSGEFWVLLDWAEHVDKSPIRVLVVEDYEPWRRFVSTTLQSQPKLQVIGVAVDGLEAVQKAEELQPDLIVLDIGLPSLDGIEAARRIRKLSPESKILFISQESSADVVQETLALGALGYVVKAHAAIELLAAVNAVLDGRQFISSGVSGDYFIPASDSKALHGLSGNEIPPSLALEKAVFTRNHEIEFYSDDAAFVVGFARFIEDALEAGKALVVVATEPHRKSLLQRLQEDGVDTIAAIEQGRYLSLDVAEILKIFMVNDLPAPERFMRVAGDLFTTASRATLGGRVAICGECGSILWAQGKADAAVQTEQLCNQLAKRYDTDVLCGFSLTDFSREEDKQVFEKIWRE